MLPEKRALIPCHLRGRAGDGGAMYGVQAPWIAAHYRIEERFTSRRGTQRNGGGSRDSLGVPARCVTDAAEVAPAIREAAARSGPSLIDAVAQDGFGE